ncbi:hypothetical protein VNI00_004468 [Paramarasmius palmivorus]|uniref:Nuclease Le1 n=1 Tax=Paramarasmius palmivorus TaxID=297713 RepID=A0AAW0DJG8_9AGAR
MLGNKCTVSLVGVLALASGANAWGASGHEAVGYIAMQFLAPKALSFVQSSLGSTYSESLGPAAPWADSVRSQSAYAWTSSLHYVDAEGVFLRLSSMGIVYNLLISIRIDDPPSSCSVSQSRDCAGGCILTAIANYTQRVVDTSLSATQRQEALKFLDHTDGQFPGTWQFIGDIGQPLHAEAVEAGGNGISVKCNGATSNLHTVWDSSLINKLLSADYGNSVTTWASTLASRIKSGTYKSSAASWISCSSTTDPARREALEHGIEDDISALLRPGNKARAVTPLACPLVWARESNALDCSYVFSYPDFSDLCTTSYYTNAVPLIEQQIAKQGYRLAAWLNVLFDGSTEL